MDSTKTDLEPHEVIKAAYVNKFRKVKQSDLAFIFAVNAGRVSEAVTAITFTAENYSKVYQLVRHLEATGQTLDTYMCAKEKQ